MTIYIDVYRKWEDNYDQAVDRYDIKCPYFGFDSTYDFAECDKCAVVIACNNLGVWHEMLCERLDSEECTSYCRERYPTMNRACVRQIYGSIPVVALKPVVVKRGRHKRKMFQFGDKK